MMVYILICAFVTATNAIECIDSTTEISSLKPGDYALIEEEKTFEAANDFCESINGQLAILDTDQKLEEVYHCAELEGLQTQPFWLAAEYISAEHKYRWRNGQEVASHLFCRHFSRESETDAVVLDPGECLNSYNRSEEFNYICEAK